MQVLPSVDNLGCFEAAARTGNFRAAAKLVALTPAAFGQRIKQLEDQLGAPLFARTTRSLRLTAEGEALLPRARKILVEAGECAKIVRGELGTPLSLTVGTRFELGLSWLLPLLPELERALPQLRANLYIGSGPDLLARLDAGTLDCVVTSARLPDPSFEGEVLFEENDLFVAATALAERIPSRRRRDAIRHRLLDIDAELPLYRYLRDAPGLRGPMRFADQRYLGLGEAVKRRVVAGEGVAVLPEYMVQAELDDGSLVQLLRSIELLRDHFRLVFRRQDPRRPLYANLAAELASRQLR